MGKGLSHRLHQSTFESCEQEALLNLFVSTNHVRQRLNAVLSAHGITMTQYNVLRILRGVHPEGHPRCEIIARMVEPAPDVTRLIDRLEKGGFVGRIASSGDGRMSVARITRKGLVLLEDIHPLFVKIQQELLERLSAKECRELSILCEKIYQKTS